MLQTYPYILFSVSTFTPMPSKLRTSQSIPQTTSNKFRTSQSQLETISNKFRTSQSQLETISVATSDTLSASTTVGSTLVIVRVDGCGAVAQETFLQGSPSFREDESTSTHGVVAGSASRNCVLTRLVR